MLSRADTTHVMGKGWAIVSHWSQMDTSSTDEPRHTLVAALDRGRRRALGGFVVSYLAWEVAVIASDALEGAAAGVAHYLVLGLGVVWVGFGLWWIVVRRRIARDPHVARALDDEHVRRSRSRAYATGFWFLGAYLIGVRLLAFAMPVSGGLVAQVGIGIAMGAAIVAFIIYERD